MTFFNYKENSHHNVEYRYYHISIPNRHYLIMYLCMYMLCISYFLYYTIHFKIRVKF